MTNIQAIFPRKNTLIMYKVLGRITMSLQIGSNYSYGYSGNTPKVKRVQGFDLSKISSLKINQKDMEDYGIKESDWTKVDSDADGYITASEFLKSGVNFTSIFNAFKELASPIEGAYQVNESQNTNTEEKANSSNELAKNNHQLSPFATNQINSNARPMPQHLGKNADFMA